MIANLHSHRSKRRGIIMMHSVVLLFLVGLGSTLSVEEIVTETSEQDENHHVQNQVEPPEADLAGTELIQVFAVCRHGDRTPDQEELDLNARAEQVHDNFFPYGIKALTNTGKVRGFRVGEFLRRRYDGFLSRLYLPEEIKVRCTDYDRTKMTALTAMASLYPPQRLQQWNPLLQWQPVPYSVLPPQEDDLLYWYNCPAYLAGRNRVYTRPEVVAKLEPYADLFLRLSNLTGTDIDTPEDVFYLDNLFQAEENVGIDPPAWADELMPRIKEMTKIEYEIEFYNDDLVRWTAGIWLNNILNATDAVVRGGTPLPKLRLYSAHENNVAALMAASRVFYPHQPNYGATFALELRRDRTTGKYAIATVYAPRAGGKAQLLSVRGCGGGALCDYETFVELTSNLVWTPQDYNKECTNTR